ncbi:MAG: tRNA 2-thiocytidine biosynthesis protein TtcA [Ruminococcus sp.]|nr:tRNA 2-thiocytidine biosynthesis protein TtcA [Ruminococcus sp.]
MQKILGYLRKCVQRYNMLSDGDRIAVGVSGGKDSMVLLYGLSLLRRFIGIDYEVIGLTIDPGFGGTPGDYSPTEDFCLEHGIKYHIERTQIGEIVFDVRKESNPCSLCARMRRGALHNTASDLGCNKIALGHSFDDTIETFIMNLFNEGRLGCYSPVTHLPDRDITLIRPLVLAPEKEIRRCAVRNELPIVRSVCPADGHTNRQKTKEFIAGMERQDKGFKDRIFGALVRSGIDGW